jgi:hypothetical protein
VQIKRERAVRESTGSGGAALGSSPRGEEAVICRVDDGRTWVRENGLEFDSSEDDAGEKLGAAARELDDGDGLGVDDGIRNRSVMSVGLHGGCTDWRHGITVLGWPARAGLLCFSFSFFDFWPACSPFFFRSDLFLSS